MELQKDAELLELCNTIWAETLKTGRLDVSDRGLTDERAMRLLKGLYM